MIDFNDFLPKIDYTQENARVIKRNGVYVDDKGKHFINATELAEYLKLRLAVYTFHEIFYFYNYELGVYQRVSWDYAKRILRCYLRKTFPTERYLTVSNALFDEFRMAANVEDNNEPQAKYLVFSNCSLDLDDRTTIEHSPKHLARNYIPHDYDADATCPIFDKTLLEIFDNDKAVIENFWEMLGAILYYGTSYPLKKIFVFMGTGANGKSLLLDIIRYVVGADNYACSRLDEISGDFGASTFYEKMVNISPETELRAPANTALLKSITGGDPVLTNFKHQTPFTARHFTKFIIATNNWFAMTDSSDGIFDRLHIFPFNQRFVVSPTQDELNKGVHKADTELLEKIKPEVAGIINKALEAQFRLKDNGWKMTPSPTCDNANKMVQSAYDPFTAFCKKHIRFLRGSEVKRSDMISKFTEFQIEAQIGNTYSSFSKTVIAKNLLHKLQELYPKSGIAYVKSGEFYVKNVIMV